MSPDTSCDQLPTLWIKSEPEALMEPMVSNAMGTKVYLAASSEYFCSFLTAAASAAYPADKLDDRTLLAARVSVTITSQVTHLPSDQGICVTPSGRLPSVRNKP